METTLEKYTESGILVNTLHIETLISDSKVASTLVRKSFLYSAYLFLSNNEFPAMKKWSITDPVEECFFIVIPESNSFALYLPRGLTMCTCI